jgi:hypothetical protein
VGGLVALMKIGVVSYWSESYWGGTCAAIGGALVIGALPRLIRAPCWPNAVVYATGLAILANTRPYEGLVLAVPATVYLASVFWRRRVGFGALTRRVLMPAAAMLIPVAAWMANYNYRVTGNPWEMPYIAHERQYAIWSSLAWQSQAGPRPSYTNAFLEEFWTHADLHDKLEAREHLIKTHALDLYRLAGFFLGLPLTVCVLMFTRVLWRDRAVRGALLLLLAFYAGVAFDLRLFPHYFAPGAVLVYIVGTATLRAARRSWPGKPVERVFVPWAIAAAFGVVAVSGWMTPNNRYLFGPIDYHIRGEWAAVTDKLMKIPGDHLVLVSYGPKHEIYQELVYNRADIEHARIIWARSLTREADEKLIAHYASRRVWKLSEDGEVLLKSYEPGKEESTMTSQFRLANNRAFLGSFLGFCSDFAYRLGVIGYQ